MATNVDPVTAEQDWRRIALEVLRRAGDGSWSNGSTVTPDPGARVREILRTRRIDSLLHFMRGESPPSQRVYDRVWQMQKRALRTVVDTFAAKGIEAIVFKGGDCIPEFYQDRGVGVMADVDLLVRRIDLGAARRVLFELGFAQGRMDKRTGRLVDFDPVDSARLEATRYELMPFARLEPVDFSEDELDFAASFGHSPLWTSGEACVVTIEFDLHHEVAHGVATEPLFERSRPSQDGHHRRLSAADHLWILVSRHYIEVATTDRCDLRSLAHAFPLAVRGGVDWNQLSDACCANELTSQVYYPLSFIDRTMGSGRIPEDLLGHLRPTSPKRAFDWGWQLGKVLDIPDAYPLDGILASD